MGAVTSELVKAEADGGGMTAEQVTPIQNGDLAIPESTVLWLAAANYDPADFSQANPVVAKQTIAVLSDSETGLTDVTRNIQIATLIDTTLVKFMGNHIGSIADETVKKKLSGVITGAAIGSLNEEVIPAQNIGTAMEKLAFGAMSHFDHPGFKDATEMNEVLKYFANSSLAAFDDAGISGVVQFESIADDFLKGLVGAFDEAGFSGMDHYKSALGPMVEGAMTGLKDVGFTGENLISLYDDLVQGSVSGMAGLGDITVSNVLQIAASLSHSVIAYIDDLGFAASADIQTASQLIAQVTMKAIGNFDTAFMSVKDIKASTKQITEEAMNAPADH